MNKKGLTGIAKISFFLILLIVSGFFIYNLIPVSAGGSATIWTTDAYGNPKTDFSSEEIVYIHGSNFLRHRKIYISITRPDGIEEEGSTYSDHSGNFVYEYQLNGIEGLYNIKAKDRKNIAETSFTDKWDINTECKSLGFDFGVAKWEWNGGWSPEGDSKGTSVSGSDTVADWNVGTSGADGIVVKAGDDRYAVVGTSGTVYQDSPAISHITFCGYEDCDYYTDKEDCEDDPDCDWCPLCEYPVTPTKVNQWLEARCVDAGTDCGYHCEVSYCGATCNIDNDCECPQDGCVEDDYYDYPDFGICVDCPTSCYCDIGTGTGQPCEPTITHCTGDGCYAYDSGCEDRDYFCTTGGCDYTYSNRNTDYYDPYEYYCSDDTVRKKRQFHDFYCNDICTDHTNWEDEFVKNCNNDDWYDTGNTRWVDTDQCNEKEQKEQEYRDYYCSETPSVDCYYDVTNTQWVDTGNTRYKDFSTYCDNGLYCDGEDHCDGAGSCVSLGQPVDCSNLDGKCQEGVCDEDLDECVPDYYDYSTSCEADDDLCTIDHCDGSGDCVYLEDVDCNYLDDDYCLDDEIWHDEGYCDPLDGECYADSTPVQDCYDYNEYCEGDQVWYEEGYCNDLGLTCDYRTGFIEDCYYENYYCTDNEVWYEYGYCEFGTCQSDSYMDEDCDDYNQDYCSDDYHWVHQTGLCTENLETFCALASSTGDCRDELWCNGEEMCEGAGDCVPGIPVDCDDSDVCTIDSCDEENDQCVYTPLEDDLLPPDKTVGDPHIECEEEDWCDYRITMSTPITLSCEEGEVRWRYALDGEWEEWNTNTSPVTIYFPEECNHTLEAQCVGLCGNSTIDSENFKVEGTKFEIPLFKKWNLISVPFVLLNEDPNEVFNDIADAIESVWTYDGETDEWYIWTPDGAPDSLDSIIPGWGYWVLTNNDTLLVVGGALFNPATTPPIKDLVKGWNLIGYYGTEWQDYFETLDDCGNSGYGNYAYCALNSLIDTIEGYPRWSSLKTYVNCGDHNPYWVSLNVCDLMYAGKGYWIEMDVEDKYAPASTCIWKESFICPEI